MRCSAIGSPIWPCAGRPPESAGFATPELFRDSFKTRYGPIVAAYQGIAADPERVAALDHALANMARRHDRGAASTVMDWEYLLLTARRR